MDNKMISYDPIEMDSIEDLFSKIYKARGGEILLIHIPPYSKQHKKTIKCFSVVNQKDSALVHSLPTMINDLISDIVDDHE